MIHLPDLLYDLALILITAGFVTVLFRKLKQPVVLGYVIAGFIVGPAFPFTPTVKDIGSIKIWAEIGVIFLLFALGLEFSFKKLARVGGAASITAVTEIFAMVIIGFGLGRLFGWSNMDSLFLGGTLAISSTTIIIRAFEELGVKTRGFAQLVFGVLVVEDLLAILLMVMLTTVAITQTFAGTELLLSIAKLVFFLIVWFVGGIFLLPTILKKLRDYLNDETLLIVSLGLCFLMVIIAGKVGFSAALGAFIMGSLFAETSQGHRIEKLVGSVKDLFAAIFFVSVGMLIDPSLMQQYAVPVIIITLVTIFAKTLSTTIGALLAGQTIRHSVQSGLSLAQIGEFSFIIATLGQQLKVTSDFLYPIVVGVSAITTFTTPYFIRSADSAVSYLNKVLPQSWKDANLRYNASVRNVAASTEWGQLRQSYIVTLATNSVIIIAIFLGISQLVMPALAQQMENQTQIQLMGWLTALVLSTPFLWALTLRKNRATIREKLWSIKSNRAPLFVLEVSRWLLAIFLLAILSGQFASTNTTILFVFGGLAVFLILFSRYLDNVYSWFEHRFVTNLSESDEHTPIPKTPPLAPWDAHIIRIEIPAESPAVGQTLQQLKVREFIGVTVALIERGNRKILAPRGTEFIYPFDVISIIGDDEQVARFKETITPTIDLQTLGSTTEYVLQAHRLTQDSEYQGKSIRDSGIREKYNGLVVGVERNGQRILNPDSSTLLLVDDLLWIVGDSRIQ